MPLLSEHPSHMLKISFCIFRGFEFRQNKPNIYKSQCKKDNGSCVCFFFIFYRTRSMRQRCDGEIIEILRDLHVFNSPTPEKKNRLLYAISLYICMYPLPAPERLKGFYLYSVFKSLSVTGRCSANMNILGPKIGALHIGPKTKNGDFSQKWPYRC